MDRLTGSKVSEAGNGLVWIEFMDTEVHDEQTVDCPCWLLVQRSTDRVMVVIDGPNKNTLLYRANADGGSYHKFISLDGAQRFAISSANQVISEEIKTRSVARKERRVAKFL